jgi:tetratricopeptide (TPR) repeat protein
MENSTLQRIRKPLISKALLASLSFLLTAILPSFTYAQEGPESAEILFSQATVAYDEGRYSDAARDLLKAHGLDPQNTDVIYYLGLSYNAQGGYAQGTNYLRKGLDIEPKNYDIQYQLGVALYGQDNYDAALKEFLTVYQAEPQRENIGYYIGLCYYQKKDYQNALTYLQRNVSTEIRTRQLNQYYTGLTLRALGREAEAIEELTEAVRIEPTSPIVGATQQLLTALRAPRIEEKRLRLELTARLQYDSNIASLPTRNTEALNLGQRASWGKLLNLRGDYALVQSERWESTATYGFLQTINYQDHNFDLHDHMFGGNVYYKNLLPSGEPFFIGTQFNYDVLLLGNRKFLERPTGAISFTLVENPANVSAFFFRLQYKDFFQRQKVRDGGDDDERRDAINKLFGLVHFIRFLGGQHQINFGYHYDNEDAQGRNWRYSGHKAVAGLLISLPWDVRAITNFEFHARFYKGTNSIFGERRQDQERTTLVSLAKDVTRNLTVTLEHLWDNTQSTIAFYKSRRQVYSLGLTWRY